MRFSIRFFLASARGSSMITTPMLTLDAILFDLDGTLTDSTRLFHAAVEGSMRSIGIDMKMELFVEWHGRHEHWEHLLTAHGADGTRWEAVERVTFENFDRLLSTDITWLPGVEEALAELKRRDMPMAVVTNSLDRFIDVIDRAIPLKTLFPVIITASFTQERRKPDPYGLLVAAERLGVPPANCLYVGDQPFDILAANGAGMHDCLFVGPHTPATAELMAKHRIRRFPDLLELIN